MKTTRFLSLILVFSLVIIFWAGAASGLIIYRFGGEGRPVPPEADSTGVDFRQLSWTDLDAEHYGQTIDLGMDSAGIHALKRNPDFNIAPGIEERGGTHLRANVNGEVWDGDEGTFWLAEKYLCAEFRSRGSCKDDFARLGTANIFLGSLYNIERIRVISGLTDPSRTVRTLRIHIGLLPVQLSFNLSPEPFSPWIVEVRDNREQVLDIPIPPHEDVDFVQVTVAEHNADWEVNEIELYARGFVKQSTYISNIIDFERSMAWGDLRWSGARDPGARVFVQTRSGLDKDPNLFWRHTGRGGKAEVSRTAYDGLKVGERAGTTHDQASWSFWSAPYDFADSSGTPAVSPSPRRYFQFKVDFLPREAAGGQIDFLEFRASEPVATNLVGEVWPIEARVGRPEHFTYALRPTIRAGDTGFDQVEIQTSSIVQSVDAVRIDGLEVEPERVVRDSHRFRVQFPQLEARDSGVLVEVDFMAQVLRYGAAFDAWVSNSDQPLEVPQGVNAGDATGEYEGNRVSVATVAPEWDLLQVRVAPAVLTPNGDGFNDGIEIGYDVLEITGSAQVWVEVLDLSGRQVRRLYAGADEIGEYARIWDGRDDAGQQVLPGIYLYHISMDVDQKKIQKVGVLPVVY